MLPMVNLAKRSGVTNSAAVQSSTNGQDSEAVAFNGIDDRQPLMFTQHQQYNRVMPFNRRSSSPAVTAATAAASSTIPSSALDSPHSVDSIHHALFSHQQYSLSQSSSLSGSSNTRTIYLHLPSVPTTDEPLNSAPANAASSSNIAKHASNYPPNLIRNQKYTLYTFLPQVLFEQFKFFFNLYFLLVALSQLIPSLKIGYIFTYFAPLGFVLFVTISKEAWDDYKRHRRDQEANSQLYQVLLSTSGQLSHSPSLLSPVAYGSVAWKSIPSSGIKVGDLVKIDKNQRVPADMILLRTFDRSGTCFIRTDQLDGETDWKLRVAVASTQHLPSEFSLLEYQAIITVDQPNKDIHSFVGNLHRITQSSNASPAIVENMEPLSIENTVWANTVLASGSVIGLVIYTGPHTRAVMNTSHPGTKVGLLDLEINKISKILCFVTFMLALALVALNNFRGLWWIYMMRFLIIFSSIIPISLRVNLDMGKTLYSWQIMHDKNIEGTVVRTSTIPEELGRIEYLLTDKTGTLTQNEMELKKLHMGTMCYGLDSMKEIRENVIAGCNQQLRSMISSSASKYSEQASTPKRANSGKSELQQNSFADESTSSGLRNRRFSPPSVKNSRHRDLSTRIFDLVQALALCHNVTPVRDDLDDMSTADIKNSNVSESIDLEMMVPGKFTYQASSPDEVAIVKWTEQACIMLVHRDMNSMTLRLIGNGSVSLQKGTSINDFDKIVPSPEPASLDNKHLGSENTAVYLHYEILHVFPFTSETKRMGIIVRDRSSGDIIFFMKGADSVMTKIVQYNDWLDEECGNMAREGLRTLVVARKRLSEYQLRCFEEQYHQAKCSLANRNENMQQVISRQLESDLELLGVTGVEDKLQDEVKSTLEILRNAGIKIWMLTGDKIETATNIALSSKLISRTQTICHIQKLASPHAAEEELDKLDVFGADTCLIIDGQSLQMCFDNCLERFMRTAIMLPAIVCCRCSPQQKMEITRSIRAFTGRRVCAIGDGGNDVSMIQAADVGVGIVGKEGKQASLAADFSVNQFSYLQRLLLWHGRNSYKRSAKLSQFVIHRGLIISIIQAVFSATFYFAPIALYQGMLLVGYSTVYTMAPVFSLVLDRDVTEELALMYPELYKDLIKGRSLSMRTFFEWLLISLYQGSVIMMLALWLFEDEFVNVVSITFTALIFNELLMVALEITHWHVVMIYSEIATLLIYLISMTMLKQDFDMDFILSWRFVWKTALITAVSCAPLFAIKKVKHRLAPPSYQKLQ